MNQLEMLCLSARTAGLPKWIKAEINPGLSTDEILSMLQEYQLEEGMPPRQMSKFGLCCPVGLHKSRTVVQGRVNYCAAYLVGIHRFSGSIRKYVLIPNYYIIASSLLLIIRIFATRIHPRADGLSHSASRSVCSNALYTWSSQIWKEHSCENNSRHLWLGIHRRSWCHSI